VSVVCGLRLLHELCNHGATCAYVLQRLECAASCFKRRALGLLAQCYHGNCIGIKVLYVYSSRQQALQWRTSLWLC
jgi:hypothetical protein